MDTLNAFKLISKHCEITDDFFNGSLERLEEK